jgi:hypothetical protein
VAWRSAMAGGGASVGAADDGMDSRRGGSGSSPTSSALDRGGGMKTDRIWTDSADTHTYSFFFFCQDRILGSIQTGQYFFFE